MRKVRIIWVGKTQDKYIKEGLAIYEKKIKRYCKFEFVTVKEASYKSGTPEQWMAEEAERLEKVLSSSNYTVMCDEKGKLFSSVEFANAIADRSNKGTSSFDFVIGGAYGFSKEMKKKADLLLSFSPMTMTHQIFRLMLSEQVYRAFTIIKGEKYHHV